jgi:hypothetical protein
LGRSEGLAEGGELGRVALKCLVCDGERPAEGSGCRQEIDDFFDRFVGAVIGEFEVAVWPVLRIRPVLYVRCLRPSKASFQLGTHTPVLWHYL